MSLPKGGKRQGSGRKAGTPNKATSDVKAYALQFTTEAIDGLVGIARDEDAPKAARVNAWDKVLDRAIGKATQSVEVSGGLAFERIERVIVRPKTDPANSNTRGVSPLTKAG